MRIPALIFLALSTALIGCSTVPIEIPKATGSAIQFVRDTGFVGGGCTFDVLINEEVIGQLKAGDAMTKQIKSGRHRVGINKRNSNVPERKNV